MRIAWVRVGAFWLIGLTLLLSMAGCCKTKVQIRAMRGAAPNPSALTEGGGYLVVICPKERVSLGWASTESKVTIDPGIGQVNSPDLTIVTPETSTTYKATAKDGCEKSDSVQVIVINNGDTLEITGDLKRDNQGLVYWEANLLPQFYSPSLIVTEVKLNPYPDTPSVTRWRAHKIDPDGSQHDLFFGTSWTQVGSVPLLGTWQIAPEQNVALGTIPGLVHFEVRMECK